MYEIYKDKRGEYRWRFRANNGKIIGVSSEGYKNYNSCYDGMMLMQESENTKVVNKFSLKLT